MKPLGYMTVKRTARYCWEAGRYAREAQENDLKGQRARHRRETEVLVGEQLDGRDPNNPCDWGTCEFCSPASGGGEPAP